MNKLEMVRCPNCGSYAERYSSSEQKISRTSCKNCDYLMVQCAETGKVIEAYAPGLDSYAIASKV